MNISTEDKNQNVMFICTRCKQLLKLDDSFAYLSEKELEEYSKVKYYDKESEALKLEASKTVKRVQSSDNLKDHPINSEKVSIAREKEEVQNNLLDVAPKIKQENSNSFTFISDSHVDEFTLSSKLSLIVKAFDIMSGNTDIEHPLCEECTDYTLDKLNTSVKRLEDQNNSYREYFKQLQLEESNDSSCEELEKEIRELEIEQEKVLKELEKRELERKEVVKEIESLDAEEVELNKEKERRTEEYNDLRLKQLELEDEQISVGKQLFEAEEEIKRLKKTNVFNATFHIWHAGPFGTINGFRLGRLPGTHIEWAEINAAWGQSVLLLSSLAKKMQLTFKKYKLVPFGNQSYIESLNDKSKELPLYGSGGLRFLWDTKFDHGMVAFLDCLQQFKDEVYRVNGFSLPYNMNKGKIEDTGGSGASFSIKIQLNSEEQWTKALKFMLTNLKWGLASVSSQFSMPNDD